MPIDLDFPKNNQVIGKHIHSDGEHYHYVWGPGKTAEAAENEEVKARIYCQRRGNRSSRYTWDYGRS